MKTIKLSLKLFLAAALLCLNACKGQDKTEKFKPDVRIKVDKEYDKNNNVIRYDSSYSYSYSGKTIPDSIFNKFMTPNIGLGFTNGFFRNDSLIKFFRNDLSDNRLFKDEYFHNLFMKDLENFNRLKQKPKSEPDKKEEQKWY